MKLRTVIIVVLSVAACVVAADAQEENMTNDDHDDTTASSLEEEEEDLHVQIENALSLADEILAAHESAMATLESSLGEVDASNVLEQDLQRIAALERATQTSTGRVGDMIRQVNANQLNELRGRLRAVEQEELTRRERLESIRQDKAPPVVGEQSSSSAQTSVDTREIENMFLPDAVFAGYDTELSNVIADIIQQEVAKMALSPRPDDEDDATEKDVDEEEACLDTADAANHVVQALSNFSQDGIGRTDHIALMLEKDNVGGAMMERSYTAGRIVHEMTSPTYEPTPQQAQQQGDRLGDVWWRHYLLPEDWEKWLTQYLANSESNWEDWSTALPTWWTHTFGGASITQTTNTVVAPPETILHRQVLPGACWPMQGSSGRVTVELPYPLHVTAVSIDHASRPMMGRRSTTRGQSAPKTVQVIGYPPCEDNHCGGLSFDVQDPVNVLAAVYELEGSTTQTFEVEFFEKDEEASDAGSCSAETLTCSDSNALLGHDDVVSALTFEIQDNWGNPDYTCIYRVRVHGKTVAAH